MTGPRFVIAGCYGEANLGDEALLAGILALLRESFPKAHFTVFSDNPRETASTHGVETLPSVGFLRPLTFLALLRRGHLFTIVKALWRCDYLVVGGGELIRTDFGLWPVLTIFDRVLLARLLGRPVLFLGVGCGHVGRGLSGFVTRRGMAGSHVVCREETSAMAAFRNGAGRPLVGTDPALFVQPGTLPFDVPDGALVGFSLLAPDTRPVRNLGRFDRRQMAAQLACLADRAVEHGASPVFIPFSTHAEDDDRRFHREVQAAMAHADKATVLETPLTPQQARRLEERLTVHLSMRLHGCVLAVAAGRPAIGICYDDKVRKMATSLGLAQNLVSMDEIPMAHAMLDDILRKPDRNTDLAGHADTGRRRMRGHLNRIFHLPANAAALPDVRITVVIPAYNARQWIDVALRSVFRQTYQPAEIIVVDDGSTDGTAAYVRTQYGSRVEVHEQSNSGPAIARNAGCRAARHPWIAFLDADDRWHSGKLQGQVAMLAERPEAAIVATEFNHVDAKGAVSRVARLPALATRQEFERALRHRTVLLLSSTLIRKDLFDKIGGFNQHLICGEDRELWARFAARYPIAIVHRPLVDKLERLDSVSMNPERSLRDGLLVNRYVHQAFAASPRRHGRVVQRLRLRRADSVVYQSVAYSYRAAGARFDAMTSWLRSLVLWPRDAINVRRNAAFLWSLLRPVAAPIEGPVQRGGDQEPAGISVTV